MRSRIGHIIPLSIVVLTLAALSMAQGNTSEQKLNSTSEITVINYYGRINIETFREYSDGKQPSSLTVSSPDGRVDGSEVKVSSSRGTVIVEVASRGDRKRINVLLVVPERCRVKVETREGEIAVTGDLEVIQAKTETGTIILDVPTDDLSYQCIWTQSRPRYVADIQLQEVKELSGGRFSINGHYGEKLDSARKGTKKRSTDSLTDVSAEGATEDSRVNIQRSRSVRLNVTTDRGIILLNVPPNEVGSDLRERPLTEAAKAIVRSGDSLLMDAIRRAAPKYYGDYSRSLPPYKREPGFTDKSAPVNVGKELIKTALVRVTDSRNRALAGLQSNDFEVTESGSMSEVLSVEKSSAPFNLVLLLDVSGSVENYVDFIRKAARSFVETVDAKDRISIVIFNDDIKVLSSFTNDKRRSSESLDSFDAGGGTAYYDALAYVIADTLRPLKGERTAVVILTDGDDNRSFLSFDSLTGSIQESGALIYPLYVPSGLVASEQGGSRADLDPLRNKYMSLTAKSEGEGDKLAKVSGGTYYPITKLSQIQQAYEDIAIQLRTAYLVKFRSATARDTAPSKLKIKVKRENTFVTINSVVLADAPR
jgi:VWFA-related protein